ncbi:hypothetical protein KSF_015590 [Reticulibacter mediterranei]|uniref:TIR domain-containing protein n=2 Tax=Reticulibacter mediterranei TaxID=2778369 RepID=A0A8J3IC01_9CHLR|nr:hypothetical protein KSF_015590 [Reticulibacter mediterranei]
MASQEHLDLFKQGVEVWNKWRAGNPLIHPNLSHARFGKRSIDLSNMNLSATNLSFCSMTHDNLSGANLNGANLMGSYLMGANLCRATLHGTRLNVTNLSEANLTEADLSDAVLSLTIFGNVDLQGVKGLERVKHASSSILDIQTVYRSRGNIPEIFLKGAGVPDSFIDYARSLVGKPIGYYTCFISHSSRDEIFVKRLYADLQSNNVRCWFAPEDLKIGDHYHQRIDESIHLYDKLVLILSEHAVQSAWVEREVVAAREKEDQLRHEVLLPIRLDDAVMQTSKAWAADVRRRWHIGDFTQWKHHNTYQQALERLLRDLKAEQKPKD